MKASLLENVIFNQFLKNRSENNNKLNNLPMHSLSDLCEQMIKIMIEF